MKLVSFKFNNGSAKKMMVAAAEVFRKRGLGTYMTTDMGHQAMETKVVQEPSTSGNPLPVDSTGALWNPDLHVASKLQNNDGTWRKKPGAAARESAE